jgi:membrane protein DedA with SNARE-associated domain
MLEWLRSLPASDIDSVVFIFLFLNNLGFPLPGNTLLLGVGFLVGSSNLSFWGTFGIAATATFLGTTCGYGLGRRYGRHLLVKVRWLRLTHERMRHMEHFFKRYGPLGVFFARFVTLLHPVIGLLAGLGRTPGWSFLFYNLIGSAAYAFIYIQAGDYFGSRWGFQTLWEFHTACLILILVMVVVGLSLFWRHRIYTVFGHPFYRRKG